jgi:adenine phosphoribosyltransferase
MNITDLIRTIPDYPKPGIMFRDITTLLSHPEGFSYTIQLLVDRYSQYDFDFVAGIEDLY